MPADTAACTNARSRFTPTREGEEKEEEEEEEEEEARRLPMLLTLLRRRRRRRGGVKIYYSGGFRHCDSSQYNSETSICTSRFHCAW